MEDSSDSGLSTVDLDLPPEAAPEVVDNGDGTSTLYVDGNQPAPDSDWFSNLALTLPQATLDHLATKYLDLIDEDMEARKERDQMQADGLKKAGLGDPAPGGADFEGASRVTSPLLMEAYIDFSAQSIKELFPPNGPVRTKIDGKANETKMERAQRKTDFLNQQLTEKVKSYRPELERLLTQLPVGGSQYMKIYWDDSRQLPNVEFVPIDDIVLPYEARNFFDLQRKFHRMRMSDFEFEKRVMSGFYIDTSDGDHGIRSGSSYVDIADRTKSQQQTDRIEGKQNDYTSENGERIINEGCVYEYLDEDPKAPEGKACPYLITIDEDTRKVLAVYRNWDEDSETQEELDYLVDFNFIPWRGVFGLSLLQCLAGIPDALTGALRALLDSALISNLQGGLKLKGNPSGASLSISPTQVTEVDSMGQDDIRKIYMPIPFNQPSPMLFQLLGFLTDAGKSVVGTAEEKIADAGNNMAVGTALALIEQGAKVFSSIHARLHDSQRRCLEILHRLYRDHLPEGHTSFGSDPNDYVTPEDFEGQMDVHPVSDPNIFSETQRFAQIQFVMQSVTTAAPVMPAVVSLFDLRELYARAFELAKIPNYQAFLPEVPKAQMLNPVDENIAMVLGHPVKAYAGQNHEAHIQVLLDFAKSPMFGQSPIIMSKFTPAALNHLQDHMLVWYEEMMKMEATSHQAPQQLITAEGSPLAALEGSSSGSGTGDVIHTPSSAPLGRKPADVPSAPDWDNDPQAAVLLAKACPVVDAASQLAFGKIPQLITQAMQQLKAAMPQPPVDPMVQVEQQRVQGEQQVKQGQLSLAQQKAQNDAQGKVAVLQAKMQQAQLDYQLEMQKAGLQSQTEMQTATLQSQTDLAQTLHDNDSAQKIAAMKINSDEKTKLSTGASLS